ncbi:F-box/kelch-repeat protein [Cardamine amara subsp. amara]|uniref:F-box/kelch-repeat protein n=1 Tax=Cardamine amara subsp. amara TaxID=228776 RepID=A0ABD1BV82_CARAN
METRDMEHGCTRRNMDFNLYSISLSYRVIPGAWGRTWFTPMAVSKEGNLFLYDTKKRLFKYYPETDLFTCLSPHVSIIAPFIEYLVPLGSQPGFVPKISTCGHQYGLSYLQPPCVPTKIRTSAYPSLRSRFE